MLPSREQKLMYLLDVRNLLKKRKRKKKKVIYIKTMYVYAYVYTQFLHRMCIVTLTGKTVTCTR